MRRRPGLLRRPFAARTPARLAIDDSTPNLVDVLISVQGKAGLQYLDYLGRTAPVVISGASQRLFGVGRLIAVASGLGLG